MGKARMGGERLRGLFWKAAFCCVTWPAHAVAPEFQGSGFVTFTNSTPVAIPDFGVVSSTITVVGAQSVIWDVDVQTFITHTYNADLDITLQSPAGTVVTLTTDNGSQFDNVFNGTVWDDDANPGGQVPYTSNNGLVTDHAYVILTTATPLVPEEALAAFVGEDPNGTWRLTISDDLGGDSGQLASWTLDITTLPKPIKLPAPVTKGVTPEIPIVDNGSFTSSIQMSGLGSYLFDVNLTLDITHTFPADLDITLQSPAGTVVTLTTGNGSGNDNVFSGTTFDDSANPGGQVPYLNNNGLVTDHVYVNLTTATPLVPEEALGAFIGENPNGIWTLTISDNTADDTGTLHSWSLAIVAKSPFMKVKKPEKQQAVKRGQNTKVAWTSEGNVGPDVRMELWRNGAFVTLLKNITPNDGKEKVKIPNSTATGGGYQIRLESHTTSIDAFSKKFKVVNP